MVLKISDLLFQRILWWGLQILAAAARGRDDLATWSFLSMAVQVWAILVAQGLFSP